MVLPVFLLYCDLSSYSHDIGSLLCYLFFSHDNALLWYFLVSHMIMIHCDLFLFSMITVHWDITCFSPMIEDLLELLHLINFVEISLTYNSILQALKRIPNAWFEQLKAEVLILESMNIPSIVFHSRKKDQFNLVQSLSNIFV